MRIIHFLIAILLHSAIGHPTEFICSPQDPTDCYPRVFSPSEDWQVIKPNQDIPAGLHVRLNIDTLQREAKLMDPNEKNDNTQPDSQAGEIVVSPEHQNQDDQKQSNQAKVEAIKQKLMQSKPKKLTPDEIDNYESSVNEIAQYPNGDQQNLHRAIENLIELSHDIEFGSRITADPQILLQLQLIGENENFKEEIYRIVGATFRNNPDSTRNFMENDLAHGDEGLIEQWIKELDIGSQNSDLIRKRVLGIFQGLIGNSQFKGQYLSNLLDKFVGIFPKLEESSKERLINIFEDLHLIDKQEIQARSDSSDPSSANDSLSHFLQDKLKSLSVRDEDQFKLYYNALLELHDGDKTLKPSKSFVAWLDEESGKRAENIRARDNLYSGEDKEFDKKLLETRHLVFGNPNALRKHYEDEL